MTTTKTKPQTQSVEITREYPTWLVPVNPVWYFPTDGDDRVPEGLHEVRGRVGYTAGPFASIRSYEALAIAMRPAQPHTHVYFRLQARRHYHLSDGTVRQETDSGSASTVLLGRYDAQSAAEQLQITADAILMVSVWDAASGQRSPETAVLFGLRRLQRVRESGYDLEGSVSIGGRSYRAFTSSQLMAPADNPKHLVSVAVLYVCDYFPVDANGDPS